MIRPGQSLVDTGRQYQAEQKGAEEERGDEHEGKVTEIFF
jgi:hypothetical protein